MHFEYSKASLLSVTINVAKHFFYYAGNDDKAMNYTIVQRSRPANTARLGDSATLECSVLSHSKNRSCLGGLSVFWFRARSHKSHPEVIFTDGINQDDCTVKHDRKCIYSFFHNVSSSEFGTYYCAIATCGEILFGNGTTFEAGKNIDVLHKLY